MRTGKLAQIHDREVGERRRTVVELVGLTAAILVVLVAVAIAARSILLAAG